MIWNPKAVRGSKKMEGDAPDVNIGNEDVRKTC
jgi:hypothetical protein